MTAYPKTYAALQAAIDERSCGYCGAEPGERCRARSGFGTGHAVSVAQTHKSRLTGVPAPEPEPELKPLKIRWGFLPKLKYKVRTRHYIWCDHHGSIHETNNDPFGEGYEGENVCEPDQWRRVYIESDDRKETF